jgi:exonuclease 3'-5' domain-containing protein 1
LRIIPSTKQIYLIDVLSLRHECFTACGEGGNNLKDSLESNAIPKVFFDVRNDSDALYSHFKIKLDGVIDLQLMELATRSFS